MMIEKYCKFLFVAALLQASVSITQDCAPDTQRSTLKSGIKLQLVRPAGTPALSVQSPGAEDVVDGFEGGTVVRQGGVFFAFLTEMMQGYSTRLALWKSTDGDHWSRAETLFASSKDDTGSDRRAALWAPMPVYDSMRGGWDLFYIAYRSKPNTPTTWYANYDGQVVRATSKIMGKGGIEGPYSDAGIILSPGKDSDSWEGLQGDDSFFAYRIAS